MKTDRRWTLDFETEPLGARPRFPKPAGLAVKGPGHPLRYYSWGHPTGNGTYELRRGKAVKIDAGNPRQLAERAFRDALKDRILGQNIFKFDLPVAEDHFGIKYPSWDRVDDSMFTLFLRNPHAPSFGLKQSGEEYLGHKPAERDAVFDWLAERGIIPKPRIEKGKVKYSRESGAHIAKAPGDLVALYAMQDVTLTEEIQDKLWDYIVKNGMEDPYNTERELAPILLENERQGIRVDMEALERDLPIYDKALAHVEEWIRKRLKIKDGDYFTKSENKYGFNFDSDAHVAQALRAAGVVEKFPQTAGGRDSVSRKNLKINFYKDQRLYHALAYRNIMDTVLTQSLHKWFDEGSANGKGYIYREWNQVKRGDAGDQKGAASGRVTVSGLANIAKRFGAKDQSYKHPDFIKGLVDPPLARSYVLPDKGHEFGHCDFDQQEMKITAHYEDGALAEQYRKDPKTDIHVFVHDLILAVSGKDYNRDVVKVVDFRTSYGGGATGLAEQLDIPLSEAKEITANWKRALPDVVELDLYLKNLFRQGDYIRTLGGRVYYVKPPAIAKKGPRKGQLIEFSYTALNYLIQPSAADQTKRAIINYHKHPKRQARLLCTVYDEINISMPTKRSEEELEILSQSMCNAFKLDVPVTTTKKKGPSWGKLEKYEPKIKKARKAA